MKRKNDVTWVLKQVAKQYFENLQIIAFENNKRSSDVRFDLVVKNLPLVLNVLMTKERFNMLRLPGLLMVLGSVDESMKMNSMSTLNLTEKVVKLDLRNQKNSESSAIISSVEENIDLMMAKSNIHTASSKVFQLVCSNLSLVFSLRRSYKKKVQSILFELKLSSPMGKKCFDRLVCEIRSENESILKLINDNPLVDYSKFPTVTLPPESDGDISKFVMQNVRQLIVNRIDEYRQLLNYEKVFNKMMSERPYHELYERNLDRKITILCAPTNSGKTYNGIQKIKEALRKSESGDSQMLFPLRVLALQVQQDVESENIPCSMITGEEQDIRDGSRLSAMTVEIFDTDKEFDTVFLDESQLAFSNDRSSGYLRVICGAKCKHLIMACAPSSLKQIETYLTEVLQVSYSVEYLQRLTPLEPIAEPIPLEGITEGDLIVAFSRRSIHEIADKVSSMGFNVGVLYGALSPAARKAMLNQYRDNNYQVLVATDAIGMGVSAPAKRVIFAETSKFDGSEVRELREEEYRQIAGRAGRYGFAEFGQSGVMSGLCSESLVSVLSSEPSVVQMPDVLYVTPDKGQLVAAKELGLVKGIELWAKAVAKNPPYAISDLAMTELLVKAEWLDDMVHKSKLDFSEAIRLLFVTFPLSGRFSKFELFKKWVSLAAAGNSIQPPIASGKQTDLKVLESYSIDLTLMIQLARVFPDCFWSGENLNKQQTVLGEFIVMLISKKYTDLA